MILKTILLKQRKGKGKGKGKGKRTSIKIGRNNNITSHKMKLNSNTHKIITIPLQGVELPNIPRINVKKKCSVFKMPNTISKLGINNNYGVENNILNTKKKEQEIINS